jgi:hypothetical protein
MRRALIFAFLLLPAMLAGQVVDRIVARVDHHVVLQSEWDDAVRFEALVNGKDLAAVTTADRQATLDRLIDQALIAAEIARTNFVPATAADVDAQLAALRKQLPAGHTDADWNAALQRYGLTEDDIRERLTVQVNALRFLDERFRPSIHIDPRAIEAYYRDTYVPQASKAGVPPLKLADASPQIEELLIQQRLDEQVAAWLKNLRDQTSIERGEPQSPFVDATGKRP